MKDVDKAVFKVIGKKPLMFAEIHGRTPDYPYFRTVDASIQRLRKAGKIRYLYKANGGPGWVRV